MTREGTLEAVVQWKRELDSWASSESEGQSTLPVVLFANKSDLLTNAKESFVLGARMEQLCRKVRWNAYALALALRTTPTPTPTPDHSTTTPPPARLRGVVRHKCAWRCER